MSVLRRRSTPVLESPAALEGPGAPWGPGVLEAWGTLEAARGTLAECQDRVDGAAAAVAAIDAEPGPTVDLDADIDEQLDEQRTRSAEIAARRAAAAADLAGVTAFRDAARDRVAAAGAAVVRAQVADLDSRYSRGCAALSEHRRRVASLLDQLRELDGVAYAPDRQAPNPGGIAVVTRSTGEQLVADLDVMRVQLWQLELAVDGLPRPQFYGVWQTQIPAAILPATIHGPEQLIDSPTVVAWDGDLEQRLRALPAD